ncbi:MAG TPA: hypothetical protein VD699_06520 [Nitrosopumilaceae archaeon]|nr:hypothetical protein [Nitrosopumilaceae archaeon]
MLVNKRAEIVIDGTPEEIWNFVNNPTVWLASNPEEHYSTEFFTPGGKVIQGGSFCQQESVAGIDAVLRGHFLHVEPAKVATWAGVATYRLLGGLLKLRVPQSGVVKLEKLEDGVRMSHDMFMDFPDTLFGKIVFWYFKKFLDGENALYQHGQKELIYFKTQIEKQKYTQKAKSGN